MWSKYDEVLVQNPFFKEIQEHHEDILEKSSEEHWVICVPRNGTIESRNITIEAILDHILIPEGEKHQTLSKKYVVVQNGYINKHSSHDSVSDSVGILFEETFYVKKKSKYKVWCIDCPLFWKRKGLALQSIRSVQNLHDCLDFLWSESLGHSILDGIKNVVLNSAVGSKAIEAEDLQTQKEHIGILYSQCLQVGMKNETINDKTEDNQFFDIFKLAVETYMQYCLGRKLIYSIGSACHQADAHLTKIIKNSSHLHYQDLGISSKFLNVITLAKSELSRINSYFTALEKINCLKKTFDNFQDLGTAYSTSDHILTVLVFIILKLNITNWVANLIYLKDFRLCSLNNSDQIGFVITSFEAAIEFIKSSEFLRLNKDCSCNHSGIKALHEGILSGQISPASPKHNEFKLSLCHPLCVCNKCNERARSENIDPTCGQSLLISATISGITEVVEFLLNQGIDPNETDCVGKTSMHHAVSRGSQSLLLLLLSYPVNLNLTDKDGNTPLHLACLNGQENCVKALIYSSKIIDLDSCNLLEETPLHLATVCGYYEIVKILLENGASPFVKNKRGLTPFDVAPNYYIKKMFQKCMHKIPLETLRSIEDGASSQPEQIEQQIENFRKIDLLLKAIESNDLPLTNFYLGFHTKPQFFNHGRCHPLCNCSNCQNNTVTNPTETQLKPVNVNMSDMNGFTPLHVAAKFGRTEVLRLLLDSGASTNVKTSKTHYTPLHLACINRRTQIVAELLKCGDCSVNSLDFEGNTPLFYACQKNDTDVVKMLLQCEADCRIRNSSGQSAFQYCEENMLYGLMKILNSSVNSCVNWSSTNSSSDDGNMSDLV